MDIYARAHKYTRACACVHTHKTNVRTCPLAQTNEKDTATTQRNTKSRFLLCACRRLHTAGVRTSGFSWSAPPPTTMLPVNPSLLIKRRDTPTRGRRTICDISHQNQILTPVPDTSLHLEARGVWGDARPCRGSTGRPAGRLGSFRIPTNLQPSTASLPLETPARLGKAGRRGCSQPTNCFNHIKMNPGSFYQSQGALERMINTA